MDLSDKLEIHAQWLGHLRMDQASQDIMAASMKLREQSEQLEILTSHLQQITAKRGPGYE